MNAALNYSTICDIEWEKAENADEAPVYYWMEGNGYAKTVKLYKPSVADLVQKRTGATLTPIEERLKGE